MKKLTSVLLTMVMLMSILCMTTQAAGGADSLKAEVSTGKGVVVLEISATEAATNGKFTVNFDADCLLYTGCDVEGILTQVEEDTGALTVSFATTTSEAVAAGSTIVKVRFLVMTNWHSTDILVTVSQFNEHETLNEQLPTITVKHPGRYNVPGEEQPDTTPDPIPTPSTPTPEEDKEVVENPDGSTTTTVTDKDGTVTETTETPDGTSATTVTDKDGNVTEMKAEISEEAAASETVTLPIEVKAAESAEEAVPLEITVPETVESVTIEIPVEEVTPGSVIVVVYPDGTEKVVPNTAMTEDGLAITVDGSVTIKVVDNTKDFVDTEDHWAEDAITFVTSRELFNGVSEDAFGTDTQMTRAMLMTVLARLDGQDTTGGSTWYEQGMEWAKENNISDGTNPNGNISREQLATMLYRYAGEPKTEGSLAGFTDAGEVSSYAEAALKWAVENGIINGMGDGTLNPKGEATRAQLAKILMYFINL